MLVRVSGGRNSRIEALFVVFQNKDRNIPIRNVPENVDGVPYRTRPKRWMDQTAMSQWLGEIREIRTLPNERRRALYVDYWS